jgi:hypothetical protein
MSNPAHAAWRCRYRLYLKRMHTEKDSSQAVKGPKRAPQAPAGASQPAVAGAATAQHGSGGASGAAPDVAACSNAAAAGNGTGQAAPVQPGLVGDSGRGGPSPMPSMPTLSPHPAALLAAAGPMVAAGLNPLLSAMGGLGMPHLGPLGPRNGLPLPGPLGAWVASMLQGPLQSGAVFHTGDGCRARVLCVPLQVCSRECTVALADRPWGPLAWLACPACRSCRCIP